MDKIIIISGINITSQIIPHYFRKGFDRFGKGWLAKDAQVEEQGQWKWRVENHIAEVRRGENDIGIIIERMGGI